MATLAPSCARTSAHARPRPLLAPPTTATLSFNPRSMGKHAPPVDGRHCALDGDLHSLWGGERQLKSRGGTAVEIVELGAFFPGRHAGRAHDIGHGARPLEP